MLFFIDLSFMQKFREKILRMTLRVSDFKKKKKSQWTWTQIIETDLESTINTGK